jgi:hypothetical protein
MNCCGSEPYVWWCSKPVGESSVKLKFFGMVQGASSIQALMDWFTTIYFEGNRRGISKAVSIMSWTLTENDLSRNEPDVCALGDFDLVFQKAARINNGRILRIG